MVTKAVDNGDEVTVDGRKFLIRFEQAARRSTVPGAKLESCATCSTSALCVPDAVRAAPFGERFAVGGGLGVAKSSTTAE